MIYVAATRPFDPSGFPGGTSAHFTVYQTELSRRLPGIKGTGRLRQIRVAGLMALAASINPPSSATPAPAERGELRVAYHEAGAYALVLLTRADRHEQDQRLFDGVVKSFVPLVDAPGDTQDAWEAYQQAQAQFVTTLAEYTRLARMRSGLQQWGLPVEQQQQDDLSRVRDRLLALRSKIQALKFNPDPVLDPFPDARRNQRFRTLALSFTGAASAFRLRAAAGIPSALKTWCTPEARQQWKRSVAPQARETLEHGRTLVTRQVRKVQRMTISGMSVPCLLVSGGKWVDIATGRVRFDNSHERILLCHFDNHNKSLQFRFRWEYDKAADAATLQLLHDIIDGFSFR